MRYNVFAIAPILYVLILLSVSTSAQNTLSIKGQVIDFDTRLPLSGVSVSSKKSKTGVTSNERGAFILGIIIDEQELFFSYLGYKTFSLTVYPLEDTLLHIALKRNPPDELPEIRVASRNRKANVADLEMSTVTVSVARLKKTPLVFGESDIIKMLSLAAGVTTTGEGAGGFNVRGGNADQNLVLLDETPLFNTSHLLGFYSAISPEAVRDFTLYKGSIPARYGGRVASLLALDARNGNDSAVRFTGTVSPVSGKFFADGPVGKKINFLIGGRVAYPKVMMNMFKGDIKKSNAFFYDGIAKLSYNPDLNSKLSLTLYRSYDFFKFPEDTSYHWQSNLAVLQWKSKIQNINYQVIANYSAFISDIRGNREKYEFNLRTAIDQKEVKLNFSARVHRNATFSWGGSTAYYSINPGSNSPRAASSVINTFAMQKETGNELAGYINNEWNIFSNLAIQAGVRYASFSYKGPHSVYVYEAGYPMSKETIYDTLIYTKGKIIKRYGGWEPRVAVNIGLDSNTSLKLSYNRSRQYLHLVSNTIAITPVDYWKMSGPYTPPQLGDQVAAGIFRNFNNDMFEASAEVYYKKVKNLVEYKKGAMLILNPYIESDLLPANGKAYGIEVSAEKASGIYTGHVAYTWSRSLHRVITAFPLEMVNNGAYYPSNFDRPHNLSFTGRILLGKGWSFATNFVYITGRPSSFPDGNYVINDIVIPDYSMRNKDRLPDYHRLDAAFSYDSRRYAAQKKYSVINISLYNVYARKNPYSLYFKKAGQGLYAYRLTVLGTIIPSITWNYNF
ncbi:TonB-dependent receptor [Agriterribacter sp.]|uniref:TonB-dependent receptor n=1 Tax=Agriterribacter sp. TaxID=2821509 RepID=UPI002C39F812|nr:TonB-dependent receptor [Agriterribacter sp.]HTN08117.1 TonB-dependent receptor [Agriterribacter sp.]